MVFSGKLRRRDDLHVRLARAVRLRSTRSRRWSKGRHTRINDRCRIWRSISGRTASLPSALGTSASLQSRAMSVTCNWGLAKCHATAATELW